MNAVKTRMTNVSVGVIAVILLVNTLFGKYLDPIIRSLLIGVLVGVAVSVVTIRYFLHKIEVNNLRKKKTKIFKELMKGR